MRLFVKPVFNPLRVSSEKRLVLVTRGFANTPSQSAAILDNCREALAGDIQLLPAGSSMRSVLETLAPSANVHPDDWPPVFPLRDRPENHGELAHAGLPTIGYFRSTQQRPWPNDLAGLEPFLPKDNLVKISLFSAPEAWITALRIRYPFVSVFRPGPTSLADFLEQCDFMVATDSPLDDPYPEELVMALDSGTIPLLETKWRPDFFGAAAYAKREDFADKSVEVFTNPALASDLRRVWQELRAIHFSPKVFAERIRSEIGPVHRKPMVSSALARPEKRVISILTNGVGMGHLTRQLAIARKMPPTFKTIFVSQSHAIDIPLRFGFACEYTPFHLISGMNYGYWNMQMHNYLESVLTFYRPSAIVIDANVPFPAIETLRAAHPELPFVWVRRAMWGEGRDLAALEKAYLFDAVIEPGEIAGAYDAGPTSTAGKHVLKVPPLVLLDDAERLPQRRRSERAWTGR